MSSEAHRETEVGQEQARANVRIDSTRFNQIWSGYINTLGNRQDPDLPGHYEYPMFRPRSDVTEVLQEANVEEMLRSYHLPQQSNNTSTMTTPQQPIYNFSAGDFVFDKYLGSHYVLENSCITGDRNVTARRVQDLQSMVLHSEVELLSVSTLTLLRRGSGFKVGDRVTVARRVSTVDAYDAVSWNSIGLMNDTIGKVGRVTEVERIGREYKVSMPVGDSWYYHVYSLELAPEIPHIPTQCTPMNTAYVLCAGICDLDEVKVLGVYVEPVSVLNALGIINDCGVNVVPQPTLQFKKLASMLCVEVEDLVVATAQGAFVGTRRGYRVAASNIERRAWVAVVKSTGGSIAEVTSLLSSIG